jgi:hypothetical protein
MKNVLFLLVSLLLLSFLSSCTAEELPETEPTLEMETVNSTTPKDQEPVPNPPIIIKK